MTAPGAFTSGDVLTAADMNDLPAGIVGGSGVGYDTFTSNASINTTPSTLLSVTFTAQANRYYQADMFALLYGASTTMLYVTRIYVDGTRIQLADADVTAALDVEIIKQTAIFTASAGSRTVTVDFYTTTGTASVAGNPTYGPWLIVKDVGPA